MLQDLQNKLQDCIIRLKQGGFNRHTYNALKNEINELRAKIQEIQKNAK